MSVAGEAEALDVVLEKLHEHELEEAQQLLRIFPVYRKPNMARTIKQHLILAHDVAACPADELVFLVGFVFSRPMPAGLPTGADLQTAILGWLQDTSLIDRCSPDVLDGFLAALTDESPSTAATGPAGPLPGVFFEGLNQWKPARPSAEVSRFARCLLRYA